MTKAKKPIYIAPIAGTAAGVMSVPGRRTNLLDLLKAGNYSRAGDIICRAFTGYSQDHGNWKSLRMTGAKGLGIGIIISKVASKMGVNKYIPNFGDYSIRL